MRVRNTSFYRPRINPIDTTTIVTFDVSGYDHQITNRDLVTDLRVT
jgi:hypothetical protein